MFYFFALFSKWYRFINRLSPDERLVLEDYDEQITSFLYRLGIRLGTLGSYKYKVTKKIGTFEGCQVVDWILSRNSFGIVGIRIKFEENWEFVGFLGSGYFKNYGNPVTFQGLNELFSWILGSIREKSNAIPDTREIAKAIKRLNTQRKWKK